jgi:hypothetical protein
MFPLCFQITGDTRGLEQSKRILSASLRGGLTGIGKLLVRAIQPRTRYFEGKERASIKSEVRGRGLALEVTVYSELVQTLVDELGLSPGIFPPFRRGTRLFRWVEKRGLHEKVERNQQHSYRRRRASASVSHVSRSAPVRNEMRRARAARVSQRDAASSRPKSVIRRNRRIEGVAFLIARKIFETGIKPTMPLSKGLEANRNRVMRELENAVKRAVAQINRGG